MADMYRPGQGTVPTKTKSMGTLANWAGAAISLGLVIGVGVWGYQLLVRDVSGVPVVRAAEGPMRIAPDDPGGSPAEHQGFAVNSVAADGAAEAPADRLVLAPKPVDLSDDDATVSNIVASVPVIQDTTPIQSLAEIEETPVNEETPQMASIQALADQLARGVKPLDNVVVVATPEVVATVAAVAPVIAKPAIKGGIKLSLRPVVRPASLNTEKAAVAVTPVSVSASAEVDAASIPAGTRLAQLGAFESPEIAKSEWDRLNARFGDYLEGKSRVIQKASSGGRTFYRLRAMGFADINDTRRFCSALVAERADCIPLVTR